MMAINLNKTALCAALLTLGSVSLRAEVSGPSRPFFAQMVLQGVTFQVETPNEGSINQVTIRALAGEERFAEESVEADGTVAGVEVEDLNADGYP